ncbi:MAG: Hydroxypyruvate isomerase [Rhodoglobus sp.]|nr:Hydroxypyruvate isomerase [Rhodoglobus sp.]
MTTRTPLRLDANLKWLFTELPFEERFDAAAQAGFTAVEFASPYGYDKAELRRRLDLAGLEQILINTPAGPTGSLTRSGSACLPDAVAEFRAGLLAALEYADALDASFVHVMGGIVPAGVRWDHAFATYVGNVAWAVEQATSTGVTLVLEAINRRDVPGFILGSIEQAASVVEAISSSNLALLFDVYHCQVSHGEVITRMEQVFPLIGHVQVADAPHRTEPGTGEIEWGAVFDTLRSLRYEGWVGCEYSPVASTIDGLGWREKLLA